MPKNGKMYLKAACFHGCRLSIETKPAERTWFIEEYPALKRGLTATWNDFQAKQKRDADLAMAEYALEEENRMAREIVSNGRLMALLLKIKGSKWIYDLGRLMEDCECMGLMRLSRRAGGEPQKEDFGKIKQIWVHQTLSCNCGDCWHGTIWVEIVAGRYLEMDFKS